ncbi:hypothetical protein L218DRAFT_940749 [Marasmius fiardii PR-910]|nr:hypothetical protein L218DRAFT_940749 [Marasmius fiardii PR-910]
MSISEFGALSPRISSPRNDGDEFLHDASFAEKQSGNYSSIGLGRPSTWGKRFKTTLSISDNSDKESSPKPPGSIGFASTRSGSKIPHEEAEELILEIIRDLVEETSGWDSSLHMEDSFRSLVRNAGITPQNSREDMRGACTDQRELPFVESVASPIEIDLGLLGLDAYRMQCAKDDQAQITESRFLEYGMPLTTLEEEEGEEADVSR